MVEGGARYVCLDPETVREKLCVGERRDWVVIELGGDNDGWTAVPPDMAEAVLRLREAGVDIRLVGPVVDGEITHHPLVPYRIVQQGVEK